MPKRKPRTGVHVTATTPRAYREFLRLVGLSGCAVNAVEGFTVVDESKWSECLNCCDTSEDRPQ